MTQEEGSFELLSWDEQPCGELGDGKKLTRASVRQHFAGTIDGDGAVEWVMFYRGDGTARFVGLQQVSGTVGSRTGSFVLETSGEFDGKVATWNTTVIAGSGTDGLDGISGSAVFGAPHGSSATFEFDYEL